MKSSCSDLPALKQVALATTAGNLSFRCKRCHPVCRNVQMKPHRFNLPKPVFSSTLGLKVKSWNREILYLLCHPASNQAEEHQLHGRVASNRRHRDRPKLSCWLIPLYPLPSCACPWKTESACCRNRNCSHSFTRAHPLRCRRTHAPSTFALHLHQS